MDLLELTELNQWLFSALCILCYRPMHFTRLSSSDKVHPKLETLQLSSTAIIHLHNAEKRASIVR